MLRITIPKNKITKESYDKNGNVICIEIYDDDDENLFTTTCCAWYKKWHKCPYADYETKKRIVNNDCYECYTTGSPLCSNCLLLTDKNLTVLSLNIQNNDRYINKKNQILCHYLIRCPSVL